MNPKGANTNKTKKKGDYVWSRKKQVYISAWYDKHPVYMIATRSQTSS